MVDRERRAGMKIGEYRFFVEFKPGDRVACERHGVGIVESIEGRYVEVAWLGSDGKPDGRCNLVMSGQLALAGENVVPFVQKEDPEIEEAISDGIEEFDPRD